MTDSRKRRSSERRPHQDTTGPEDESLFMPTTPRGHPLDEAASALQKAIRRAREGEALYWMWELLDGGYAAYFHRRIQIIAAEEVAGDIQLGAAIGQLSANAERASKAFKGRVEGIIEAQQVLHLARAVKSREAVDALGVVIHAARDGFRIEPPAAAIDQHTRRGRAAGRSALDFKKEGRLVAGPLDPNRYEERAWGERQPFLPRPEDDGGEPDIEFPPVHWRDE